MNTFKHESVIDHDPNFKQNLHLLLQLFISSKEEFINPFLTFNKTEVTSSTKELFVYLHLFARGFGSLQKGFFQTFKVCVGLASPRKLWRVYLGEVALRQKRE